MKRSRFTDSQIIEAISCHQNMTIHLNRFKLGYVPHLENHAVSQMLDRGEKLVARIVELQQSRSPWKRVQVVVKVAV